MFLCLVQRKKALDSISLMASSISYANSSVARLRKRLASPYIERKLSCRSPRSQSRKHSLRDTGCEGEPTPPVSPSPASDTGVHCPCVEAREVLMSGYREDGEREREREGEGGRRCGKGKMNHSLKLQINGRVSRREQHQRQASDH